MSKPTLQQYMTFQGLSGFYRPGGLECQLPNLPGINFKVLADGETFMMWNRGGLSVTGGAGLMANIFASGDLSAPDPDIVEALTPEPVVEKTELISPEPEVTSVLSEGSGEPAHGIGDIDSEESGEAATVDAAKADAEVATPPASSDPLDDLDADMLSVTPAVLPATVEDTQVETQSPESVAGVPFRKVRPAKAKK